jgi:ketosteroid isomerase-like protein
MTRRSSSTCRFVLRAVDRQTGRGKGSGAPLDQQTFSVITIREGKIVRVVWLPTREQAFREAAGLRE